MKNLKKCIMTLCLITFSGIFAQTAPEVQFETMDPATPLEELSYEYLMAHKVFLREKPSLRAKKLTLLNIGTKLVLWEKSQNTDEIDGIKSNWYRVSAGTQAGWVWGGMIAQHAFGSEADYRVKFVYGYESSTTDETGIVETKYQLRAFKNGFQLDKIVLDSLQAIPTEVKNIGNKGIFNVEDIISLGLVDPRSGSQVGTSYVFWNNGKFTNVANLIDYHDVAFTKTESFVFPSDMEGIRSTVVLKTLITHHEVSPENGMVRNTPNYTTSFYAWNGYKLFQKEDTPEISTDVVANLLHR